MALTKETIVDQITVTENGTILYREVTKIIEDGNQISQNYHRTSLIPGQDLINKPSNVVAICNLTWTPEVISAFQEAQAAIQPPQR